jgi:hypothetical protein
MSRRSPSANCTPGCTWGAVSGRDAPVGWLHAMRARLELLGLAGVLTVLGLATARIGTSPPQPQSPLPIAANRLTIGQGQEGGLPGSEEPTPQPGHPEPLTYICDKLPCTNGQEFEIFDHNGAPIFSVGEYGGADVYGDNLRIWAPNTNLLTGTAAITFSWESPAAYAREFNLNDQCAPPAIWESPQAIWKCTSAHTWKIVMQF